jgi:hypothetical protein
VLGAPPAFVLSQDQTLSLTSRRHRRRAFGSTASLHKAGPKGVAPQKGRSPAGIPRQALKGDRLEPRAAPPRPSPQRPTGPLPDRAAASTPERRRAVPAPPPYRCLSRDPKAAAHASLPHLHLSKDQPGIRKQAPAQTQGSRNFGPRQGEPGQALTIAPDRVCRASRAPDQGPFGDLAHFTVSPLAT